MSNLFDNCHREVVELHEFLAQWLAGNIADTSRARARFEQAFAPECILIAPTGVIDGPSMLQQRLIKAHGVSPGMDIRVEDFLPVWSLDKFALVQYTEWRHWNGQATGRISSVLFGAGSEAPNGVVWRYIHETWLAGHGPNEQMPIRQDAGLVSTSSQGE